MSPSTPAAPEAARVKDVAILCLLAVVVGLAVTAWRQQLEIERRPAAAVTIHLASARAQAGGSRSGERDASDPRMGAEQRAKSPLFSGLRATGEGNRRTSALARLAENPEFRRALEWQRQAVLDARFAELFRRMNLDASELVAFKHLLVEKENVALDLVAVSETQPEGPLPPDLLRAGVTAARAQVEDAIRSSLGSERYAVYRDFERTLPQRATVAQLELRLSYSGAPLTAGQADALVNIFTARTPADAPPETVPAVSVVVGNGSAAIVPLLQSTAVSGRLSDEMVAAAQSVLSVRQVEALRQIQAEQAAAEQAFGLIRETVQAGDGLKPGLLPLLQ